MRIEIYLIFNANIHLSLARFTSIKSNRRIIRVYIIDSYNLIIFFTHFSLRWRNQHRSNLRNFSCRESAAILLIFIAPNSNLITVHSSWRKIHQRRTSFYIYTHTYTSKEHSIHIYKINSFSMICIYIFYELELINFLYNYKIRWKLFNILRNSFSLSCYIYFIEYKLIFILIEII